MSSAQGRDVSSWQESMDLRGCDFVFVRATAGDGSWSAHLGQAGEVRAGVDGKFAHFWAQAGNSPVARGAYHFLYPDDNPVIQARLFLKTVLANGLRPGDMLVVDSEIAAPGADSATYQFLVELRRVLGTDTAHHPLLTYTNHDVGQHLSMTAHAFPELWFAWPSVTAPPPSLIAPWKAWRFWQWGKILGVDADGFNGPGAALAAWIAPYLIPDPPKPPPPPPVPPAKEAPVLAMVHVDPATVPANVAAPGIFLYDLGSGRVVRHVTAAEGSADNVKAHQGLGLPGPVLITYAEYVAAGGTT